MQQDKTTYTVDFENAHNYFEIHDALKSGLDFPEYYGANLDALYDCLTEMIDNDSIIILKNFQNAEKASEDYANKILKVFHNAKHYADDLFPDSQIIVEKSGERTVLP